MRLFPELPSFRQHEFPSSHLCLGSPRTTGLQKVPTPHQQPSYTLARQEPRKTNLDYVCCQPINTRLTSSPHFPTTAPKKHWLSINNLEITHWPGSSQGGKTGDFLVYSKRCQLLDRVSLLPVAFLLAAH